MRFILRANLVDPIQIFLFLAYGYFLSFVCHFCLELTLETCFFEVWEILWGVHDLDHSHSLATFQWSGLSNQQTLLVTENCLQYQKWCPYRVGVVSIPVVANKVRNSPASIDQVYTFCSQPRLAQYPVLELAYLHLSNFFASAKPIFKMDMVWPLDSKPFWLA